jgi:hypothetical protein
MVEHVVDRGGPDAPRASPVHCCSWPVVAVLEVDAAGQRRDVAAATMAPAARMALPGVAAGIGAGVWRRGWLMRSLPLAGGPGVATGGRGRTRALFGPTQTWPKFRPEMDRAGHAGPITSHRWSSPQRSVGTVGPEWTHADQMDRPAT